MSNTVNKYNILLNNCTQARTMLREWEMKCVKVDLSLPQHILDNSSTILHKFFIRNFKELVSKHLQSEDCWDYLILTAPLEEVKTALELCLDESKIACCITLAESVIELTDSLTTTDKTYNLYNIVKVKIGEMK